jgi:hypothetical protein
MVDLVQGSETACDMTHPQPAPAPEVFPPTPSRPSLQSPAIITSTAPASSLEVALPGPLHVRHWMRRANLLGLQGQGGGPEIFFTRPISVTWPMIEPEAPAPVWELPRPESLPRMLLEDDRTTRGEEVCGDLTMIGDPGRWFMGCADVWGGWTGHDACGPEGGQL